MITTRRSVTLAALVVAATISLAGCAQSASSATAPTPTASAGSAQVSGAITVYTSEPQDKVDQIVAAFNKEQPGVTVSVFRAATGDLSARIAAEKKTGGVKGDILWAADAGTFDTYASEKMLAKFTPADASSLNKEVIDPKGYFVGTRIIPTVIAYNTNLISTPPTSWKALADPKYAGKITMPNPDVSGAAAYNAAVWFQTKGLGESWLTKLAKNKPVIAQSNGPVSQSVATGTQPIGVVVDYLVRDLKKAGSPIAVSYPSEGVPYVSEPIGIFADSKAKPAAEAFEDFVVSKAGQKLAVQQNYLPVRSDVGTPAGAPAMSKIKTLSPDLAAIQKIQPTAVDKFDALFG